MSQEWKKTKTIYWSDELNDDFDKVGLSRPELPKNYKYKRQNPFYIFFTAILYYVIAIPILFLSAFFVGMKTKGRRNYRLVKKEGCFIYSNHVSLWDPIKLQTFAFPGKRINIIGYSDALSIPVANHIIKALGYLPLPLQNDFDNMKRLDDALSYYVNKKHQSVIIYPEAHIWPYYTEIRNFKNGSFSYPAKNLKPVLPVVTLWKKRIFGKKPKQLIKVGTPIYPDPNKSLIENRDYLRNECYEQMKKLAASEAQVSYIKYIYKKH